MDREENNHDQPRNTSTPANRNPWKLVRGLLLALVPGVSIMLILTILNRGGRFALLCGLFGMLLYGLFVFVQWIFGHNLGRKTPSQNAGKEGPEARQAFVAMVWPWLLFHGLLAIGAWVGLVHLPDHQTLVFGLISVVLGLLFCISAFSFVMISALSVAALFVAEKFDHLADDAHGG